MREKNFLEPFVPRKARHLLLGSFAAMPVDGYDWYFGTKRNQFWTILENTYFTPLKTKTEKQKLFRKLNLAITDIILECERIKKSNLDINLKNLVFNTKAINDILKNNKIKTIYFSSRFAEKLFRKEFKKVISDHPDIQLITLPSPSPRFAAMSIAQKTARYSKVLPKLK